MKYMGIIEELVRRYPGLIGCRGEIESAAALLVECFRGGNKVLICGNGGSAADAGHIAGELMKSFLLRRPVDAGFRAEMEKYGEDGEYLAAHLEGGLPVISLCTHTALMTAVANDTAGDTIFAQQVMALGRPGDVLWAISTSGSSKNCVYAAMAAKARGMRVFALTGMGGGKLGGLADVTVAVPEKETFKVQEYHLPVYHALCAAAEAEFFG